MATGADSTAGAAAGWGSLSAEMCVKIWRLLPSPTLWSCRLVCKSWDREITEDYAALLPHFDPTTCDMTRMQDYHGFAAPEMGPPRGDFATVYHTRRMLKSVQHLKLTCTQNMSTGDWGTVRPHPHETTTSSMDVDQASGASSQTAGVLVKSTVKLNSPPLHLSGSTIFLSLASWLRHGSRSSPCTVTVPMTEDDPHQT